MSPTQSRSRKILPSLAILSSDAKEGAVLSTIFSAQNGCRSTVVYRDSRDFLKNIPILPPDLLVVDCFMPAVTGVECARRLKTQCESKTIILFGPNDMRLERFWEAIEAGVRGLLVLPPVSYFYLLAAKKVLRGGIALSAEIGRQVLADSVPDSETSTNGFLFSTKERAVLNLAGTGMSTKEIAGRLGIAADTVSWHFRNIYQTLGVHNRSAAVACWTRNNCSLPLPVSLDSDPDVVFLNGGFAPRDTERGQPQP